MNPELARMLASFLGVVWWVVLARVILSWVVRDPANPVMRLVGTLTDPWMRPLSRHLTFGGIDLSPIVVMIAIRAMQSGLMSAAY
jgi:uncharacterized protein YggT (Ycf19 family)